MAELYNHKVVEPKWQKVWDDEKAFAAPNDYSKPKFYALVEFPYPSGQGLHVGHPRPYTALDIVARKRRMQGYNVLYPMGWDAFGLPTENFAIKNNIHPKIVTKNNVARFKDQLHSLGYSFDWEREVNTTDPEYYKWTQWIFLKLFNEGFNSLYHYICSNSKSEILMYMIWSNESKPEVQRIIANTYIGACKNDKVSLAPVGIAWDIIRHNHPEIKLYMDGNHATKIGAYLAASGLFYALTNRKEKLDVNENSPIINKLELNYDDVILVHKVLERVYNEENLINLLKY